MKFTLEEMHSLGPKRLRKYAREIEAEQDQKTLAEENARRRRECAVPPQRPAWLERQTTKRIAEELECRRHMMLDSMRNRPDPWQPRPPVLTGEDLRRAIMVHDRDPEAYIRSCLRCEVPT